MKPIIFSALFLLLIGCGGSDNNGGTAPGIQSNITIEREFTFDGNENTSVGPVVLKNRPDGLGCQVNGTIVNISANTCDNIFVEFNATDENNIIISQTLDNLSNIPSNTGATFSATFPGNNSQLTQCNEIDDIQLEITDYCG